MATTWDPTTAPGDCTFANGDTVFIASQGYGESCYATAPFPANDKRYVEFDCTGDDIIIGVTGLSAWNAFNNLGTTADSWGYGTGGGNSGLILNNNTQIQSGLGGADHTHTTGVSIDSTGTASILQFYRDGVAIGTPITLSGNPTLYPAATSYGGQQVTLATTPVTVPVGFTGLDAVVVADTTPANDGDGAESVPARRNARLISLGGMVGRDIPVLRQITEATKQLRQAAKVAAKAKAPTPAVTQAVEKAADVIAEIKDATPSFDWGALWQEFLKAGQEREAIERQRAFALAHMRVQALKREIARLEHEARAAFERDEEEAMTVLLAA